MVLEQILSYPQALCSFCSFDCTVVFLLSDTLLSYYFLINPLMFLIKQLASSRSFFVLKQRVLH